MCMNVIFKICITVSKYNSTDKTQCQITDDNSREF